jgi:hypothetical protein
MSTCNPGLKDIMSVIFSSANKLHHAHTQFPTVPCYLALRCVLSPAVKAVVLRSHFSVQPRPFLGAVLTGAKMTQIVFEHSFKRMNTNITNIGKTGTWRERKMARTWTDIGGI